MVSQGPGAWRGGDGRQNHTYRLDWSRRLRCHGSKSNSKLLSAYSVYADNLLSAYSVQSKQSEVGKAAAAASHEQFFVLQMC